MKYELRRATANRGAIEQAPSSETEGLLFVGDTVALGWKDDSSAPLSVGHDECALRPAFFDGRQCWLVEKVWVPARGYCASGRQQSVIPLEEGVALLVKHGACGHLFDGLLMSPKTELEQRGANSPSCPEPVEGELMVAEKAAHEWDAHHSSSGHDECTLFPALQDGRPCWLYSEDWRPASGYSAYGTNEGLIPSFEDGVRELVRRGAFEALFPPPAA